MIFPKAVIKRILTILSGACFFILLVSCDFWKSDEGDSPVQEEAAEKLEVSQTPFEFYKKLAFGLGSAMDIASRVVDEEKMKARVDSRNTYLLGKDKKTFEIWGAINSKEEKFKEHAEELIGAIEKVDFLVKQKLNPQENDRYLFLSGLAKSELAIIMNFARGESEVVKGYNEKHKNEFMDGSMGEGQYLGGDFKKILEEYGSSPLVEEAALELADNLTKGFHCEMDIDCQIYRELHAYLPYLKDFPASERVTPLIDGINLRSMWDLVLGRGNLTSMESAAPYVDEYFKVIPRLSSPEDRARAFYPVSRAFIVMGEWEKTDAIYKDLLENYLEFFESGKLEVEYEKFKEGREEFENKFGEKENPPMVEPESGSK